MLHLKDTIHSTLWLLGNVRIFCHPPMLCGVKLAPDHPTENRKKRLNSDFSNRNFNVENLRSSEWFWAFMSFGHSFHAQPWTCSKADWPFVYALMRYLYISNYHVGIVHDRLTRMGSSGRKHNSLSLHIWLWLIIEKDSCLFIDLSSVPYFWALFFLCCVKLSSNTDIEY